ncbi:MAG: protocatechuate 3,4-dioxygenase subunit alpha [Pseudomonadota bacterium]
MLPETPSQTAGPFLHIGMAPEDAGNATWPVQTAGAEIAPGAADRITVALQLFDGTGTPVRDALIEVWQAEIRALARLTPAADGAFALTTPRPTAESGQAPHLTLWIIARGINTGLHTRLYLPEDAPHPGDPVLSRIEQPARRATLIAEATGPGAYAHSIRLQGDRETVFLDV